MTVHSIINLKALTESVSQKRTLPQGYKTFFILNSDEHENYPAHKC